MRDWWHRGLLSIGAGALGLALAGCASQHDDSLRLSEELGRARADAAWQQARAAALESRMSRLESAAAVLSAAQANDRELVSRIDRLLEQNARLLAEHRPTPARSEPSAAPSAPPSERAATLSEEDQLRALVERMRGRPGVPHGGLTREQEAALRVLTRPERKLDTEKLWPAFY